MEFTPRDMALIGSLLFHIRLATLTQLADAWWSDSPTGRKNAAKRLARLVQSGWLSCRTVLAHPLLPLAAPEHVWEPGHSPPNVGALAWRLQSRWKCPAGRVRVYCATPQAARRFGGCRRHSIKNLCQVTHDLHVAGIYFRYVRMLPALAPLWVGEDILAPTRRHQKLPDAVLRNASGDILRVIEFGGRYPAKRVAEFHADCALRQLPYELW